MIFARSWDNEQPWPSKRRTRKIALWPQNQHRASSAPIMTTMLAIQRRWDNLSGSDLDCCGHDVVGGFERLQIGHRLERTRTSRFWSSSTNPISTNLRPISCRCRTSNVRPGFKKTRRGMRQNRKPIARPSVQSLHDLLDNGASALAIKDGEYTAALARVVVVSGCFSGLRTIFVIARRYFR